MQTKVEEKAGKENEKETEKQDKRGQIEEKNMVSEGVYLLHIDLIQREEQEVERQLREYEEKLRRREAVRQAEMERRTKSRREIEK